MKRVLTLVAVAAITFSFSGGTLTYAEDTQNTSKEEEKLIDTLSAIENIPDSVIENGEDAIKEYLEEKDVPYQPDMEMNSGLRSASVGGVAACAGSVGYAAVTNLTPAKLTKVKSAIKSVGGATKFVKAMKPLYKQAKKQGLKKGAAVKQAAKGTAKKAGPDTKEALLDFFGANVIIGSCAPLFEN